MRYKYFFCLVIFTIFFSWNSYAIKSSRNIDLSTEVIQDSIKNSSDSVDNMNLRFYVKNAHASYYADKFNGRKTASGKKFDNTKYTAAHKNLPFGTKLKVTNQSNNKWIIVEVTDRGPFVIGRELDLSKKAFFDIAKNKLHGTLKVTIEIIE